MRGVNQFDKAAVLTIATEGSALHLSKIYDLVVFDEVHELTDEF